MLTEREKEIGRLLTQGMTNAEIGQRLFLSTNTIKTYMLRIFEKVGANNRTQAAVLLVEKGLL